MYALKSLPEDFVVEELPARQWSEDGRYLVVKVTKRERNTEDVASELARQLRRPRKDVSYAGLKDRNALTTQFFSVKGAKASELARVAIDKVELSAAGFTHEPLSLGSLRANHFSITVRHVSAPPRVVGVVPNFFDEQRFSDHNDEIGKALVKGDFSGACVLIDDERVLSFLADHPSNPVGALRRLPRKLLTLYVHAYQSRLFNRVLERLLAKKTLQELQGTSIPLVGFGTEDLGLYEGLLEEEGLTTRDFIIRQLPEVSSEGSTRQAVIGIDDLTIGPLEEDELNEGKKKCLVAFTLPKGAYATNVIRWLCSESE